MAYKITKIQVTKRKLVKRYEITRGRSFLGLHFWKWSIYFPIGKSFGRGFGKNTLSNFYKGGV